MDAHKTQRMALTLTILERYHKGGNEFLNHIVRVIGDETWVYFVNVETKEQPKQWMHAHLPNKLKKFKRMLSARKLMAFVFWDRKGILMVEFMQQGTTIMSEVYCKTLKELHRTIQNKGCGILIASVVLLHDNACPPTAALEHCWSVSVGSSLTTLFTAQISLRVTTACLNT
jgi:hypothetical protein